MEVGKENEQFSDFLAMDASNFGGEGFMANEEGLDNILNNGGSPVTEETPEPVKPKKEETANLLQQTSTEDFLENVEETPEEETEEVDDTKVTEVTAETTEVEESSDNTFSILAENLIELGIFNKLEDEQPISTGEQFKERWEKEKQIQVNNSIRNFILSKHGEEGLEVFNSIFVNGVSPQEYLSKYNQIESLSELDLQSESNQEQVFRLYQQKAGWSQEKINKYLEKYKNLGELEEIAKDLHEELLKQEEEELQDIAAQAEIRNQQMVQAENFYQNKIAEILSEKNKKREFDGIPVTDKVAEKTFSYLVDKKYQLKNGDLLTSFDKDILELRKPENYELKVKIALLLQNGFDFSKIKTKAVTETKDKVFNNLIRQQKTQVKKQVINNQGTSSFFDNLPINK